MTVGAISTNNNDAVICATPAVHKPVAGISVNFAETLSATAPVTSSGSTDLDAIFEAAGRKYDLSPNLLKAIAKVESDFRSDCTSRAGAMGIMQLMPSTAKYVGVTDAYDPVQNIMGGANYIRQMIDKFGGDIRIALSAYNAGPGRVSRNGGQVLSFTENYINKVLGYFGESEITPESITYSGYSLTYGAAASSGESTASSSGSLNFNEILPQVVLMKLIEMQMSSSDDDKNKIF